MKNTLVVSLFAGPGVGKSTMATGIFSALKFKGIECEYVSEYAKNLVWGKERLYTRRSNLYFF
jgi:broad-specificity NMP kinase